MFAKSAESPGMEKEEVSFHSLATFKFQALKAMFVSSIF